MYNAVEGMELCETGSGAETIQNSDWATKMKKTTQKSNNGRII